VIDYLLMGGRAWATIATALLLGTTASCGAGPPSAGRSLPGISDPSTFVLVPDATPTVELHSVDTGALIKDVGMFAPSITNNGLALSPDAQSVYGVVVENGSTIIERMSVADGRVTSIGDGEQPAISPNGRYLGYGTGPHGSEALVIRDLRSGSDRSIDLSHLLGPQRDLVTASITWLGDSSQIVVLPGGVAAAATDTTTSSPPGSCSSVAASDICLIVASVEGTSSLTARRVIIDGVRADRVSGDALPHSFLMASSFGKAYRVELRGSEASATRLFSLPSASPVAFDPRGTQLLYLIGQNPVDLWIAELGPHGLERTHRLIADVHLGELAW